MKLVLWWFFSGKKKYCLILWWLWERCCLLHIWFYFILFATTSYMQFLSPQANERPWAKIPRITMYPRQRSAVAWLNVIIRDIAQRQYIMGVGKVGNELW